MSERPNRYTVIPEAAQALFPKMLDWLEETDEVPDESKDEIVSQLQEMLEDSFDLDGYRMAKYLEDQCYWDADETLVELLGQVHPIIHNLVDQKVKEWVKENQIVPQFSVGSRVTVRLAHKTWHGTIVNIMPETAQYVIQADGKDYTRKFPPGTPEQTIKAINDAMKGFMPGQLVNFEDVSVLPDVTGS